MARQKDNKTESQVVYERIEELKSSGLNLADAARKVAEERDKKPEAVKANYYNFAKKVTGKSKAKPRSRRSTRAPITVDGAVDEAKAVLQQAVDNIDGEVDAAKQDFEAAKARYEQLVASVKERKASLEKRIKALS